MAIVALPAGRQVSWLTSFASLKNKHLSAAHLVVVQRVKHPVKYEYMYEKFFSVEENPDANITSFFFRRNIALENYTGARILLQQGLLDAGCLLAQQAIEILLKGIMDIFHKKIPPIHNTIELMEMCKVEVPSIQILLNDPEVLHLLTHLGNGYKWMRFGEAKTIIDPRWVLRVLDKVMYDLKNSYSDAIREPKTFLYLPAELKAFFLKDNLSFTEAEITDDQMAAMMPMPLTSK